MNDYSQLIKQLRYCANIDPVCEMGIACPYYDKAEEETHYYRCTERMMNAAADAIEELMRRCEQFQYMPPPAWIPVTERLPGADVDVLAFYEAKTPIEGGKTTFICRASYIPKFTVLVEDKWSNFDGDWEDYCEENDSYYVPEGWYEETSQGNGDYYSWNINATVTHWMPLPELPAALMGDDE